MQIRSLTTYPPHGRQNPKLAASNADAAPVREVRFGNGNDPLDLPFPIGEWFHAATVIADRRPDKKVNGLDMLCGALAAVSIKLEEVEKKGTVMPRWKRAVYEEMAKNFSNYLGIPMAALRESKNFPMLGSTSFDYDQCGQEFEARLKNFMMTHGPIINVVKKGIDNNTPSAVTKLMTDLSNNMLMMILQTPMAFQQTPPQSVQRIATDFFATHFDQWSAQDDPVGKPKRPQLPAPTPPGQNTGKPAPRDLSKDFPELHKYGNDMIVRAHKGLLPPVLLRREAIDRVIAMVRSDGDRTNVLLNAPSGEGKTFLVNGLAQRIAEGDVPDDLKNAALFQLDLGSMVAGTQYRGQFEERVKKVLEEIETYLEVFPNEKVIMFIDEIHSMAGTGSASGSQDILNLLKASGLLERKNLTWIGATTPNDWQKSPLRMDNAFAGRFKELHLPAFNDEEKLAILSFNAEKLEDKKKVVVPMEMLEKALREAKSAYPHNALRRSVDVLNLAASLATGQPLELSTMRDKLQRKEMWLKALERQKTHGTLNSRYTREFNELPKELANLKTEIANLEKAPKGKAIVSDKYISQAMAVLTGETLSVLSQDEVEKLYKAKEIIGRHIVGQKEALEAMNQALMEIVVRMKSGNKDNRPITSMILVGPTGVGKTESVKVIAKEFMNDKLIRLDMSDFMEKFAASRITGAPPGYVGYEDGSALTDKVRENPQSVILFDEIEKAHPDVFNLLLQILEEGELVDNHGQKVSFRNTVVAMTSNLNQSELSALIAKHRANATGKDPDMEAEALDRELREAITQRGDQKGFRPELLGRTDYVIPFNKLTKSNVSDILDILLRKMNENDQYLKDNNLTVKLSDRARQRLIELVGSAAMPTEEGRKNPIGFGPFTPSKEDPAKDEGLQAGARDARKHFSRKIIREVYKELILNKPNLADANLIMDYDPATGKWKLLEEPKVKPVPPSGGDTPPPTPKTIAFA